MSKYPREGLKTAAPSDLVWLTGNWRGKRGDETIEEYWSELSAGTLMGMFRWERNHSVWFYEFVVIEAADEQVYLRIKHFYPGLKGWEEKDAAAEFRLVQLGEREAVFFQINKPNGPWMIYRQPDDKTLISYFETDEKAPEAHEMFNYARI